MDIELERTNHKNRLFIVQKKILRYLQLFLFFLFCQEYCLHLRLVSIIMYMRDTRELGSCCIIMMPCGMWIL